MSSKRAIDRLSEGFTPVDEANDLLSMWGSMWGIQKVRADKGLAKCEEFLEHAGVLHELVEWIAPVRTVRAKFEAFKDACARAGLEPYVIVEVGNVALCDYLLFGIDVPLEQLSRQFTRWNVHRDLEEGAKAVFEPCVYSSASVDWYMEQLGLDLAEMPLVCQFTGGARADFEHFLSDHRMPYRRIGLSWVGGPRWPFTSSTASEIARFATTYGPPDYTVVVVAGDDMRYSLAGLQVFAAPHGSTLESLSRMFSRWQLKRSA